jgi:hypothetical protein
MTKYFIKFDHCLNGFWNIFTLSNILLKVLYFHKYFKKSFNVNNNLIYLEIFIIWILNYLILNTIYKDPFHIDLVEVQTHNFEKQIL